MLIWLRIFDNSVHYSKKRLKTVPFEILTAIFQFFAGLSLARPGIEFQLHLSRLNIFFSRIFRRFYIFKSAIEAWR